MFNSRHPHRKVAVITRTRERPFLLQRAMRSVLAQTNKDFVWIIVNDGGAKAPIESLAADARKNGCEVLTLHLDKQSGMEFASNKGIKVCSSDFITIHDDDDTWHPDFLTIMTSSLQSKTSLLGVACRVDEITERIDGETITEISRSPFMPWIKAFYLIDMLQQNLFPPIALLFRRSVYDKLHGFDARLPVLGDWDFHLRMLRYGDIGLVDQKLASYHLRHDSSVYGNTVTKSLALHAEVDAMLRNRWLRHDLDSNRFGLGSLAGLARQHNSMWKLLFQLAAKN